MKDFSTFLAKRKQQSLYRHCQTIQTVDGVKVLVDGRQCLNFCSNDYLGLTQHPTVKNAFRQATVDYPAGSGSAHLICGHSRAHQMLEEALAEFTGRDRALLFSTGYMANIGVISAISDAGDCIFQDRLNHASLLDGALLSKARLQRYQHRNIEDLSVRLTKFSGDKLIVTDGVFSMDGDLAPLDKIAALAQQHGAGLMLDDAHGMAVLGENGGGTLEHFGLTQEQVPVLMGTLGKGFGTFGAFVAGSHDLIDYLTQSARSYIYTTAMPAAVCVATLASLKLVQGNLGNELREKLQHNIAHFKHSAKQLNLPLMPSDTAIQPLLTGESDRALEVSDYLWQQGLWISAIRPPTVPEGQARLRITLSALHQPAQIDTLLDALSTYL
jgi:8-amino-7-oxononanoate synthase